MNYPILTSDRTAQQQEELILQEFRLSAIPDRLTMANVRFVEGDEAVEILAEHAIAAVQKSTSFVGLTAQKVLNRYHFARAGAWAMWGTTLEGDTDAIPLVKPRKPRLDFERQRPIKYETPGKAEALPILPFVDDETAANIYQRYGAKPQKQESFWQVVKRCQLPIAITEGVKKALALVAHGLPAIAIRGITQWHKKGSNELHQALADFATPKRAIYIVFDQDSKASTRRDVKRQVLNLATALESQACKPSILVWDSKLGKGIDDCLFAQGAAAQAWFQDRLTNALTLAVFRRDERLTRALAVIEQLNQLSYPVERATTGEYLPELPALQQGAIHVLPASMNAGKTTRIGQDWVQSAIAQGWNVLVLSPLNSLGQQTANDWNLPHIHTYGTNADQQQALGADISASHGVVMCPDSLHRLPVWFAERPMLLVLDEANQVAEHITEGNTLGSRWADILERFALATRHASATGAIVLAEDGIPDRAVAFIKTVSDADTVRVFSHKKQGIPWQCTVYRGQASGFRARFLQAVRQGQRLVYVTTSQLEAKRMHRAIAKDSPSAKTERIDSETNQGGRFTAFFESPDTWLEANQPDVLILSPSAKSGVSIQGSTAIEAAYFKAVWGYFPTLTTDTHAQLLGRFRPPVPRVVFCPDFALNSGDESLLNPRAIKRRLRSNVKAIAGVYGLDELLEAQADRTELMATIETAVLDYRSQALAVAGAQKSMLHLSLLQRLESAGHQVTAAKAEKDATRILLWKAIQEEIWREDAAALAAKVVNPEVHTPAWARHALDSLECSLDTRILAQKVLYREEFPGMQFDCPEECYRVLCQDYGVMRRGVMAQAKAENLEGTREADRAATEANLKGSIRAFHRLPKNYAKAMLRAQCGVLSLLDGNPYSNADQRAIAVKDFALEHANRISYLLRLQIKKKDTPVEICHKLLAQFGLERDKADRPGAIEEVGRPGKRGEKRNRFYAINLAFDPMRMRVLEAARRKLCESVSSTRIERTIPLRVTDTEPNTPSLEGVAGGKRVKWGTRLGEWIVESIDGATAQVRAAAGWATGRVWAVPVSDLSAIA